MADYLTYAGQGQLMLKKCLGCGDFHFYPRPVCPHCLSGNTQWSRTSGEGVIYSFSVMRRSAVPYVIAYVQLAEGVSMMTNVVDCDPDALRIGQKVRLTFRNSEGHGTIPVFAPSAD
ncbi:hypothetical protein APY03_4965 [Variovorax sp. WDL1]|nr:hypothetical protein APY03_4965 [Variovorax sp. WDL1]